MRFPKSFPSPALLCSLLILGGNCVCPPLALAYTPDGQVPTSLAPHMPSSWDLSTVTRAIWVDASAENDGNGSADSPRQTIQAAVEDATPGTVILVRAGFYNENVRMDRFNAMHGTASSPILLVSADGLHAATVKSTGNVSTFSSYQRANWGIIGFKVICAAYKVDGAGDHAPIKIGGTFDEPDHSGHNWFIAGNLITGQGHDGSKSFSVRNMYWIGNTYEDLSLGEEVNDNVTVGVQDVNGDDNQFGFNTIRSTVVGDSTNMTIKMGSNHYKIFNNEFGGTRNGGGGSGMRLGGTGDLDKFPYPDEPQFFPPAVNHSIVAYNRFNGNYGKNIQMVASQNCIVSHNDLDNPYCSSEIADIDVDFGEGADGNPRHFWPYGNEVSFNVIRSEEDSVFYYTAKNPYTNTIYFTDPEYAYSIHDNHSGVTFDYTVGADAVAPLIHALIRSLVAGARDDPLAGFRAQYGLADDGSDDEADWSQNGVSNLAYFAFGLGDPRLPRRNLADAGTPVAGLPKLSPGAAVNEYTLCYTKLKDAAVGIGYRVCFSEDMRTWQDLEQGSAAFAVLDQSGTSIDTDYELVCITIRIQNECFFKVVVDVSP